MLLTNIRSYLSKNNELCSLVDDCEADIIALTETWLTSKVSNSELLRCNKSYNIYRCDRTNTTGGGVLLAVNKCYESFSIPIKCDIESVWCCLSVNFKKIVIGVCYRAPSSDSSFCDNLYDCLNQVTVQFPAAEIIIMGDFNFPSICWSGSCPFSSPSSSEANRFIELCADFNLHQIVSSPTRVTKTTSSLLDLVLTSSTDLLSSVVHSPGLSDHNVLHFSITLSLSPSRNRFKTIRDYRRGNFEAINSALSTFLDQFLTNFDNRPLELNWQMFKRKVNKLYNQFIPIKQVFSNNKAPWYNRSLNRLSNKKKRLFRIARHSQCQYKWEAYKNAASTYLAALKASKYSFFHTTLPNMLKSNPKGFWRVFQCNDAQTISLTTPNGDPVPSQQCATILNNTFIQSFSSSRPDNELPHVTPSNFPPMNPIIFEPTGIKKIIKNLKLSSSCGADGITSKFLKNTIEYCSIIFKYIFSQSLRSASLPQDWKMGKVVPIFKSGETHNPLNYRPISLTSIPCKIMEHVIFTHLVNFLEDNNFFCKFQHGFRKSFSCETQLLSFTHDLHTYLDSGFPIDCVFLDFCKAFDKVNHLLLLYKLSVLNIDPAIVNWIRAFLLSRFQFVATNDSVSDMAPVESGVPQGSVLGPLLFLIYINDLPNNISSQICLFADDCVVYRRITTTSDVANLQSDLNHVHNWCVTWRMELNTKKCKYMRVSRSNAASSTYVINNINLESVTAYRYLGVHITNDLSWKHHVEHIISKSNRTLGYIKRNHFLAPSSLKLLLYTTYIRPQLEYASSVWDPHQSILINAIEAVQNRSVRFILANYHRTASVTEMKAILNIPPLAIRRKQARISLFHKIYYHNATLRSLFVQPPPFTSARRDHCHKVKVSFSNTVACAQSFLPKTTVEWNNLPSSIVNIRDPILFKHALINMI